jgi:hypothetical protein
MSKLKSVAVAVVFVALFALVVWQVVRARRLMAELAAVRNQLEQAAAVREENKRLAVQLQSATERAQVDSTELARLRGQSVRLHQVEKENVQLKSERDRLAKRPQSTPADEEERPARQTPEAEIQGAKGFFGRDIGLALIMAANANDGIVPTDLRGPAFDMVDALSDGAKYNISVSQFELVFAGSLRDLKEGEERILAREREPVQRSDGQWERVYVMSDGSSQRISAATRDGFAAREREFWPGQFRQ